MRICRFTDDSDEPRYGLVTGELDEYGEPAEDATVVELTGDPMYAGIQPTTTERPLADVVAEARRDERKHLLRDRIGREVREPRHQQVALRRLAIVLVEVPAAAFGFAVAHQHVGAVQALAKRASPASVRLWLGARAGSAARPASAIPVRPSPARQPM